MINQAAVESKPDSVDIKEYLAVLLKRKWLILVCFLLSMAGTTAFLFTRQAIYRANLKLLVTTAGGALPTTEVYRENENRFYGTQIDIMKSQTMLRRVQQRMKKTAEEVRENLTDLTITPVRSSAIVLISVDSPSRDFARDFANALADEYLRFRDEQRAQHSENALLMLTREINRLSQESKAAQDRYMAFAREHNLTQLQTTGSAWQRGYYSLLTRSRTVKLQLAAAKVAGATLERANPAAVIALLNQSQAQAELDKQIAIHNAHEEAIAETGAPAEPIELAERTGDGAAGVAAMGNPLPAQFAGSLPSTELADASRSAPTATRLEDVPEIAVSGSVALMAAASLDAGLTRSLIELDQRRTMLESRVQEMTRLYKSRHPSLIAAQRELEEVNQQIQFKIQLVRDIQRAQVQSLEEQVAAIDAELREFEATGLEKNQALLQGVALYDDVQRVRNLYNTMLNQLMKVDSTQSFQMRTISILESAVVQPEPVYPKKMRGLMVAALFGIGLGLALAFFIEYIDDSIKLAEEVERDLQLPFLGMIPAAQWSPDDLTAHRLDKLKQQGGVAESYRVVRSAIIFSTPREKLRSILLTSAVPREGKTTTCVNLSIGFAQIEERVLLIDGDLRRGEIHKYFGFEREKGLSDVLLGEMTPEQAVRHTDVPKLDVITSGAYPANPAELLLGWRLKELLEWAYKNYDRIIIDCTPVMGIADSAILGSAVDGCLFVIWAGRTSRRYVRVAKMTAVSRGAKIFGFVLNNLEPGRVGYYHYYPYYYSYYSRGYYYSRPEDAQADAGKGGDIKGIEVPSPQGGEEKIDDVY